MNGRYDYEELRAAAVSPDATEADLLALGKWFSLYGDCCWNGEYYDADGLRLYPLYKWDEELDEGEIVGYEFR